MPRGELHVGEAAARLHDRRGGEPLLGAALHQAPQIAGEERRESGVDLGRRRALELAERPDDLVRERDVDLGQPRPQLGPDGALVLGEAVGVQQADGDGLDVELLHLANDGARALVAERPLHPARGDPLRRRDAALLRDERRWVSRTQAVQVLAGLPAELDDVGEPLRHDERGARAASLEEGVRRHGHPVRERPDLLWSPSRALQGGGYRGDDALGLVLGRGRRLGRDHLPACHEHGVGEGPADVHAQQQHGREVYRIERSLRVREDDVSPSGPRKLGPSGDVTFYAATSSCSSVSARCW